MKSTNNKICASQLSVLFLTALFAPILRLFPSMSVRYGERAGWIAPIIAAVLIIPAAAALGVIFGGRNGKPVPEDLGEAYRFVFGNAAASVIFFLYALWTGVLFLINIRYYTENLLSTIFTTVDIRFFAAVMMGLVFMAVRGRIETFTRFTETMFIILSVFISALLIMMIPSFKAEHVFPVTHLDAAPVLKTVYPALSIFALLPFFLFLGGKTENCGDIKKYGLRMAVFLAVMSACVLLLTIGTLGNSAVRRMPMPFFNAVNIINLIKPFDRLETFLVCVWVTADFITIASMALILAHIIKTLVKAQETKYFAAPMAFGGYAGSIYLAANRVELDVFVHAAVLDGVSIALGLALPLAALLAGRLRGKW